MLEAQRCVRCGGILRGVELSLLGLWFLFLVGGVQHGLWVVVG